jgi:hypothetical protein
LVLIGRKTIKPFTSMPPSPYPASGEAVACHAFKRNPRENCDGKSAILSKAIRSALVWLGEPDPLETAKDVVSEDPARELLAAILTGWYGPLGDEAVTTEDVLKRAQATMGNHFERLYRCL